MPKTNAYAPIAQTSATALASILKKSSHSDSLQPNELAGGSTFDASTFLL